MEITPPRHLAGEIYLYYITIEINGQLYGVRSHAEPRMTKDTSMFYTDGNISYLDARHMIKKIKKGYTLVELLVVVVIIGVLVGISFLGYDSIQADTRDKQRSASATIIAEALEKYYQEHGEYPGTSTVTATDSSIAGVLGITDAEVLVAPNAAAGTQNSLISTDLTMSTITDDVFAYVATCDSATTCNEWELQYREETSGDIRIIRSRGVAEEAPSGPTSIPAPDAPIVDASLSGANVVGIVTADVVCDTGTPEYRMQSRQDGGLWSPWTTYALRASTTISIPLTPGITYGFQAVARCVSGAVLSDDSDFSNEAEYYQAPSPGTPSMSAALSGTNAVGTSSIITCTGGLTPEYQLHSRVNGGAWSAWTAWSGTRTLSVGPVAQGSKYEFQAHARCGAAGATSSDSNISSYIHPIAAPAVPSITAVLSGSSAVGTIATITCPGGTTASYQMQSRYNASSFGAFSAWSTTRTGSLTAYYGARHQFIGHARCISPYINGATATTATATYVHPFNALTENGGTVKAVSGGYEWTSTWKFTHTATTSGMSIDYGTFQCRKHVKGGSWAAWSSDFSGSSTNYGDSKCGYVSCSHHDDIQFRYSYVRATSPYDTGPSITPVSNTPGCIP